MVNFIISRFKLACLKMNQISDYLSRNPVFQSILKENSSEIGGIYPSGDQNDQKEKAKPVDATSLEKGKLKKAVDIPRVGTI